MADGTTPTPPSAVTTQRGEPLGGQRLATAQVLAFVTDAASEAALREGLTDVADGFDCRRGGVSTAIQSMQKLPTPQVLIVDVSGEEQPLGALHNLSDVVEPDVIVLVIGEVDDIAFYRVVTRNLGAMEYLAKPLTRDLVNRFFSPVVRGHAPSSDGVFGGKLVTITGVRGGVGASVIAANLAWHFGVNLRRHTVLLDTDLYRGTAALMLDVDPGPGLRTTLESPGRIDTLLAERVALPAADRLHVLASQTDLTQDFVYAPGAAVTLIDTLRRRYNAIIVDLPFSASPLPRELLAEAQQRVLVLNPTLPSVRDTLRLLALCKSMNPAQRAVLVLNRAGTPGGLNRAQVEEALQAKIDVLIPDLPRQVNSATLLGEPAAANGAFRAGLLQLAHDVGLFRLPDGMVEEPKAKSGLFGWLRS